MSPQIYYSCVVDKDPKFCWQCFIFVSTLLENGKVSPENIFVHTLETPPHLEQFLVHNGVNIIKSKPWGDLKYCNKLCQFDTVALFSADYIFICDCDLAFIDNIGDVVDREKITAKTVDAANPSLEIIERLFDKYGCKKPTIVDTYSGQSFQTNCNGGLYGIPQKYFKPLGEKMEKFCKTTAH